MKKLKEIKEELKIVGTLLFTNTGDGAEEIAKGGMCVIATRKETDKGIYVVTRLDSNTLPEKMKDIIFEKRAIDKP